MDLDCFLADQFDEYLLHSLSAHSFDASPDDFVLFDLLNPTVEMSILLL